MPSRQWTTATFVAALAVAGTAHAAEQQASFAVAITLHAIFKPLAASQLCLDGKPLDRLNVAITVSCPGAPGRQSATSADPELRKGGITSGAPTVVVSF